MENKTNSNSLYKVSKVIESTISAFNSEDLTVTVLKHSPAYTMDKVESKTTNHSIEAIDILQKKELTNIVAIGASTEGLEALQDFFFHLPQLKNTCILIAQHLSPTHKSLLVDLLSKKTTLTFREAFHGQVLESDMVYISPSDKEITVIHEKINLQKTNRRLGSKLSIDVLFKSLAQNTSRKIVATILSGTGSDGASGIKSLKEIQAFIIVQDPKSAKYSGMPFAAIQTGMVDVITTPDKIGEKISDYLLNPTKNVKKSTVHGLEALSYSKILSLLSERTDSDFSTYKTATIRRALEMRMSCLSINRLGDYLSFLGENPDEHEEIFKTILIGVTSFFRKQVPFNVLETQLQKIIGTKKENESIRICLPGCSTGEEPYTIAILLHRILKLTNKKIEIQLFATDIDDWAIQKARKGIYGKKSLDHLPEEIVQEYFVSNGTNFQLKKAVQAMVLFSKHDLISHPPFLKLDLISCRNFLVYFNAELKQRILSIFHYALLSGGYLFLGKSETVGNHTNLFESVDSKNKIFKRKRKEGTSSLKTSALGSLKNDSLKWKPTAGKKELKIALEKTKKELKKILEFSGDVICSIDKSGRFISVSAASKSVFGYEPEELIGKTYINYVTSETKEITEKIVLEVMNGVSVTDFENEYYKKDGTTVSLIWSVRWDEEEQLMFTIARDATDLKDAQKQIILNEKLINEAQILAKMGSWNFDFNSSKLTWTDSLSEVFGTDKETFKENRSKSDVENVKARIHPEEIDEILTQAVKTIKSCETTWWFEHRYLKADGSYAHVSNKALIMRSKDGKATRIIGTMQDITQKKLEEQHLKLMEKVITNTNDAIVITNADANTENGPQILYINQAFSRVTGYTSEEIIGKSPGILQGPNTNKKDIQKLNQAFKNWEHFEITLLNYKKDGRVFWNNISIKPVTDSDGKYSNWISIQRDVTVQKYEAFQNRLLDDISKIFSLENKLIYTLEMVLTHLAEFGNFDLAEAWLVSADRKRINLLSKTVVNQTSKLFYLESGHQTSFTFNEGIAGYVWKTHQIEVWDKVNPKVEFIRKAGAHKAGLNAVLGLPLLHNDILLGVLIFGSQGNANELLSYKNLFHNLKTFLGGEVRRKQLEEELKNLFNTAPDVICISGLDGYFKKINPAACTLLEYTEEELLSIPFMELIHPDDRVKTANRFLELPTLKDTSYFENRYLTKSGKTIWLSWSTTPSEEEELIFSVAKDMTNQKTLQILLDSATNLAKIGGWEMVFGSDHQTWSKISMEIHEVDKTFKPTLENFIEFFQGDVKEQVRFHLLECLQHGISFDFESPIQTAKGNKKWIRTIGNAEMRNGKATRIYGSFQDIDDRKHAEKKLQLAYEEKNTILERIGDAFYSVDNDWTVTYWNAKAVEFLGIKKETILNQNLWDIVKENHKISLFDKFLEFKTFTDTLNYEHYFERLKVWYSISAYPNTNGISVFFKDITQRKLYVEQIRESNERFEIVAQATNDAIWDYNVIAGEVYHGEGYRTLFGYPSGINNGGQSSWEEKIHPDDRLRLRAYFNGLFENPKIFDLYSEYKYKRADGSYAYVIDRGIILRDESGHVTQIIGAIQDVTERKHYEESLKELNIKLEIHAKELAPSNAELEQFAYVASHDLQEPLRMVTSFLTQLDKKYKPELDEKAHQYIEFAVDGATRMRQIILDLLDFSRVGKHEDGLEEISLSKIVYEVLKLQGKLIEETGAQFQVGDLPTLNTFRSPILQIFQNLIGNALKYRKKDSPPIIKINAVESETDWLFSIEDNGIGIEKAYFDRVFIIFQRLHSKNEYCGTGMGLAIVKKIIDTLNGKVWVTSELNRGSTFYFTLPKNN